MKKTGKGIALLLVVLLQAFALQAQGGHTVRGIVKDHTGQPAVAATVLLLRQADSGIARSTLADEQGGYLLENISDGLYHILVTMAGYPDYRSDTLRVNGADADGGTVLLQQGGTALQAVTITARKPFLERKADRTVMNVDAMIGNAGATALDVLEKAPGVRVDQDGSISLKGKQGVVVFIDDKPTYMSGTELQNYLRAMPSSTLEQVELMPNPPARYDAAGNAGVINIRLKKNRARGFNGNLNLAWNQGKYARSNNSLNLNFREGKVNAFATLAYGLHRGFNDLDIYRRYKNADESTRSLFSQNTYILTKGNAYSGRAGLDYYIDERNTVGFQVNGMLRPASKDNDNTSIVQDASGRTDSTIRAMNTEREHFRNGGLNLNYRHRFKQDGRELTADLDYIDYRIKSDQVFDNMTAYPDGVQPEADRLTGRLPATISIYSFKTDYTHPLSKGYVLSGGLKASYIRTDNLAEYFYARGGLTAPDYDKSNNFVYKENISAAYLNLAKDFERLSVQAGLRVEHTYSDGHQLGNAMKPDSTFTRSYVSLFPTVFFNYKLDSAANHQLSLNYGRRINRPYYQDLNPFISPLDKFTYYVGNPFLKPAFTHAVSLSYTLYNRVSFTASYSHTLDEVNETIEMSGNTYFSRPGNIGRSVVKSLSADAGIEPVSWLGLHGYTELTNIHSYSRSFYTGMLDNQGTFWFVQANVQARLGKGWVAEVSGRYITDVTNAQFISLANGAFNLGLQKSIGQRATLKLNVNDLFYTAANNGIINNLFLTDASWTNRYDTRQCVLSFSYRFGKAMKNERRHNADGADTEKGRVKG